LKEKPGTPSKSEKGAYEGGKFSGSKKEDPCKKKRVSIGKAGTRIWQENLKNERGGGVLGERLKKLDTLSGKEYEGEPGKRFGSGLPEQECQPGKGWVEQEGKSGVEEGKKTGKKRSITSPGKKIQRRRHISERKLLESLPNRKGGEPKKSKTTKVQSPDGDRSRSNDWQKKRNKERGL